MATSLKSLRESAVYLYERFGLTPAEIAALRSMQDVNKSTVYFWISSHRKEQTQAAQQLGQSLYEQGCSESTIRESLRKLGVTNTRISRWLREWSALKTLGLRKQMAESR